MPAIRRTLLPAALCALAAGAARAHAQPLTADEASRVDAVFARFTTTSPGCALGVRRGGALVYTKGYGLASLELGVPIAPRTVFDIGSTSKQMTAASVALLALDGKLSLDDDVRKHVPELPDLGHRVTLRHLLTHTSGWRDYLDVMSLRGFTDRDHTTPGDAMEALLSQRALNFPPGTDYRYSNTGFFLMSVIVQRVSGQSLADFARVRFFEPLGMTSTKYLTDSRDVIPNKASAYEPAEGGGWRVAMSNWEQIGDGAVQTTVEDMAKWDANLDDGRVGGRALLDLLTTTTALADGSPVGYGLGLGVDEYRGVRRVSHGGAWAGFRAHLTRFPAERVSALIACNLANANTNALADGVSEALLPAASLAARPTYSTRAEGAPTERPADLAGTYVNPGLGPVSRLVAVGDTLMTDGPRRVALVPLGGRRYRHAASGSEWRWVPAAGRAPAHWIVRPVAGTPFRYERVEPAPAAPRLADYVGTYASAEVGTELRVVVRDTALVVVPRRGEEAVLRPAFRDGFAGAGLVRFERNAAGRVVALTVTTRGVQALRFARVK